MAFQKEFSHEDRVAVTSPLLRRRAAVSQVPASSSNFTNSVGSPYARKHGNFALPQDDHPSSALEEVVFEETASGSSAPSALLAKGFHGWATCTFQSLSSHAAPDAVVATLLAQNRQLAAALKMQDIEFEEDPFTGQSCEESAAGAASSMEVRRTQSEPGVRLDLEVEVRRLRAQLTEAAAEKQLLMERSWKLDIYNAQQKLMAAKPCRACGEVACRSTAEEGEGSLTGMELYHVTGMYIDEEGNIVL